MLYYNNQIDDAFFTSGLSPCTEASTAVSGRAVAPGGNRLHFQCRDSQRLVTARHQQAVADGLFEGL
jgi:hypothetical protein